MFLTNGSRKVVGAFFLMTIVEFSLLSPIVQGAEQNGWWGAGKGLLDSFIGSKETKSQTLTVDEIGKGLKEALRVGSANVVEQLGAKDGFNRDQAIHIPLPEQLQTVKIWLSKVGLDSAMDDLELKLNRAAESATPKAKALFLQAISEMSIEDVQKIYQGPDDAATRYFQKKMNEPLSAAMRPVIKQSLSEVGAVKTYNQVMGQYKNIPFVPDVQANLTEHVLAKGLEGVFYYLAIEEAAIRKNPVKRTTEILKQVFGNK